MILSAQVCSLQVKEEQLSAKLRLKVHGSHPGNPINMIEEENTYIITVLDFYLLSVHDVLYVFEFLTRTKT